MSIEANPKIVGVKDGVGQVDICREKYLDTSGYDKLRLFLSPQTYWQRLDYNPPQNIVIECAILREKSKLTDFMGFSPFLMACPFLLSKEARALFIEHNANPSNMFNVRLFQNGNLINSDYSLFYSPYLDYETVDFSKSRFRINTSIPSTPQWQYFSFANLEDYQKFAAANQKHLEVDSMVMSESFDSSIHFFKCRIGPMYVSERLKEAIEGNKLSGLCFSAKNASFAISHT